MHLRFLQLQLREVAAKCPTAGADVEGRSVGRRGRAQLQRGRRASCSPCPGGAGRPAGSTLGSTIEAGEEVEPRPEEGASERPLAAGRRACGSGQTATRRRTSAALDRGAEPSPERGLGPGGSDPGLADRGSPADRNRRRRVRLAARPARRGPGGGRRSAGSTAAGPCWPDHPGRTDVVLGLADHPVRPPRGGAGESAGALFDSTEIDEILTLRVLTLTEDREGRGAGDRPAGGGDHRPLRGHDAEDLQRLHGALRDPHALATATDAGADPGSFRPSSPRRWRDGVTRRRPGSTPVARPGGTRAWTSGCSRRWMRWWSTG